MNQFNEALSISIIGGADGPTSIFISKQSLWMVIIELIIITAIFVFAICGFVKNIKKKKIIKAIVYGIIGLSVILFVSISAAITHKAVKENLQESIELYESLGSAENTESAGIYKEKEYSIYCIEDDWISKLNNCKWKYT